MRRLLYELSEEEAKEIGHTVGSSFKVSANAVEIADFQSHHQTIVP
jgi:hypothetical protein